MLLKTWIRHLSRAHLAFKQLQRKHFYLQGYQSKIT